MSIYNWRRKDRFQRRNPKTTIDKTTVKDSLTMVLCTDSNKESSHATSTSKCRQLKPILTLAMCISTICKVAKPTKMSKMTLSSKDGSLVHQGQMATNVCQTRMFSFSASATLITLNSMWNQWSQKVKQNIGLKLTWSSIGKNNKWVYSLDNRNMEHSRSSWWEPPKWNQQML